MTTAMTPEQGQDELGEWIAASSTQAEMYSTPCKPGMRHKFDVSRRRDAKGNPIVRKAETRSRDGWRTIADEYLEEGQGYEFSPTVRPNRTFVCANCGLAAHVKANRQGIPTGHVSLIPDKVEKARLAKRPIMLVMPWNGAGVDLDRLEKVRKHAPALSLNLACRSTDGVVRAYPVDTPTS